MKKWYVRKVLSWLLRLVALTWRFRVSGIIPKSPSIVAFWHGNMLAVWKFFAGKNAIGVTSLSRDGDALAGLLTSWKYKLIRGSSSVGGKEALDQITEAAQCNVVLITPDGPKGPPHIFKPGAVVAASRSGSELVLCKVHISRKIIFKTWDSFEIPLPFTRIDLEFLPAIRISQSADREEIGKMLERCEEEMRGEFAESNM
ncbi:MAG: lysophospholipid acyltransferase family protein [Ignavibacteria bacterium]|nr:lysophospholipid acyltransferase family protein [Ignavibacteria bacterium]